jgi:anti-anti-sigma regulatory factor
MEAARRAQRADSSFRLAGIGVQVTRLFELTGANTHLNIFPDLETALKGERAH